MSFNQILIEVESLFNMNPSPIALIMKLQTSFLLLLSNVYSVLIMKLIIWIARVMFSNVELEHNQSENWLLKIVLNSHLTPTIVQPVKKNFISFKNLQVD